MMIMLLLFLLMRRYYCRPVALLFLVVVCLVPSRCCNKHDVIVDALSVSTDNNHRRFVDQSGGHNNPRGRLLATEWIAEKIIGIGTRFVLLAPPSLLSIKRLRLRRRSADVDCNNKNNNIISVRVKGTSNRQILQGNLQSIMINVNNSHGLLFDIDSLTLLAFDVKMGLWPLVLLTSIPILLSLRPSPLLILFLYWFYRSSKTYSAMFSRTTENNKIIGRPLPGSMLIRRFFKSLKKRLDEGKSPWSMKYKLCLSQANINQSPIFRFGLKQVLRSLMLNSVLKVAAVTGDTMNQLQKEMDNNNNNNNSNQNSRFLRLNPSSSGGRNDSDVATPQSSSTTPRPRPPEPVLTKLLEATNFELDNVTLDAKDGHVIMDANAIMKDKTTTFSYTLRVIPESTRVVTMLNNNNMQQQEQQEQYALAFAKPECRFATSALVQGGGGILEKFLPDLWIPVGPGVALPLGTRHRIENVCIVSSSGSGSSCSSSSDKNNQDKPAESTCEIAGRFSFNNNDSSSIITGGGGSSSSGPSSQQKALPPSGG